MMRRLPAIILASLFCLSAGEAYAHPHMWVIYDVKAVSGPDGITQFRLTWQFDAMFTQMVKEDLGLKTVTEKDWNTIRDYAFTNLSKYHYYTTIKMDDVEFKPKTADNFSADLKSKGAFQSLFYHFTLSLPKPAKKTELTIWDDEFYVDLEPPTHEAPGNKSGSVMTEKDYVVEPFIKTEGTGGAKAPTCTHRPAERTNPVWGKFTIFVVECAANP